jgi:hypothetical protein
MRAAISYVVLGLAQSRCVGHGPEPYMLKAKTP